MLTKSDFLKYIQCPKYIWLYKHRKDLLTEEIDENLQRIFDEGYRVETYAYKLFPGGVDAQVNGFKESIAKTKELMSAKTSIIFQPTISSKDLFCRADIIKLNKDGKSWDIYEVKSATQIKNINIYDLSFQKICFESKGYKIGKSHIVIINNQYVRQGEIDPKKLLRTEDITADIALMEEGTKLEIKKALEVIEQKEESNMRILKQCRSPYECTFLDYCWKDLPKKSIYSIAGGLTEKKLNILIDEGILEIKDIPENMITKKAALRQYHAEKYDEIHIEKENIKDELAQLKYPLYFLDYETFSPVIPLFNGYRPYQRMIFQYSLHVQEKPGKELKHYAYLAKGWEDPSEGLAKDLKENTGATGSFISWNMGFEKGCNTEMGERYHEFLEFFEDVNNRMFDLMNIFRKGYYVHKDFYGSASLKRVLPVIVPDLSYGNLEIQEGMSASNKWREMIDPKMDKKQAEEIYNNLLKYCELDTLAMVRILKELVKILKGN